jgi:hypothetical protein
VLTTKGASLRTDTGIAKRTWLAEAISRLDAADQREIPAMTALIKRLAEL